MRALGEEPLRCQASYVRVDIDFFIATSILLWLIQLEWSPTAVPTAAAAKRHSPAAQRNSLAR